MPRLRSRKKSITEIIQQDMDSISVADRAIYNTSTPLADDGRQQISSAAYLISKVYPWARDVTTTAEGDDNANNKDRVLKVALS
jgi:hypothetical protein